MAKKTKKSAAGKKKPPNKKTTSKTQSRSWLSRLFHLGMVLAIWGGIAVFFICSWYFVTLPDISEIKLMDKNAGVDIYDRNEHRIARVGQTRGETVVVDQLPDHLKQAVISIEDRRFYNHFGIDVFGVSRAMMVNVKAGGFVQGGSTLTQQLAKNLFLEPDKTLGRKIQEAMLSLWIEHKLTKDEIMTAYLNRVYFGAGAYGVTAAANRYYNKQPTALTLSESASLAAALKAPSRINPIANPADSAERAKTVLETMSAEGYITQSERAQAAKKLDDMTTRSVDPASEDTPHYYMSWVLDQVGNYTNRVPDGVNVYTDFDPRLNEIIRMHVNRFFENDAEAAKVGQIAVVLMEFDGTVRALIGGQSYSKSQFNRAVQARRQPGSAFKPFVYLAGLEKGYRPDTLVWDAEFDSGSYRPQNFDGKYHGEVTFREALMRSLNTAAVRLADDVGIRTVARTAKDMGISTPIKQDLSSSLGSSEVTLMDLTAAYAAFGNGGEAVYPHTIEKLKDKDGKTVYTRRDYARRPQVASRRAVADLQSMLHDVVMHGTGHAASIAGARHIGGKTGTSQDYRDAWFVGYGDGYALGVWMGNDDNTPTNRVTGGSHPARLWGAMMRDVLKVRPIDFRGDIETVNGRRGLFDRMVRGWAGAGSSGPANDNRRPPRNDNQDNGFEPRDDFQFNQ